MEDHPKYKKMIQDTDARLKGLMAKWVLRYDYFGFLFSTVRRKADVTLPYPAAIAPTPEGTLELLFNPIVLSATSDIDLNEILHHEGLHILNKHISRMMRILADIPKTNWGMHQSILNKACDCCVNEQGNIKSPLMIAGAPFHLIFPNKLNLLPKRMMEEYYYTLLERERQKEENGEKDDNNKKDNSDGGSSDDENSDSNDNNDKNSGGESDEGSDEHDDKEKNEGSGNAEETSDEDGPSGTGESEENDDKDGKGRIDNSDLGNHGSWTDEKIIDPHSLSRRIDTYTQRIIRDSARNYQTTKNRGSMPGYLQDLIDLALRPPEIPYYEIIRQLVKGSKIGKYKRSSTHINRKRTYVFQIADESIPVISPFPGRKRDMTFKIGVLIDTSGSQSTDDVMDALSGCKSIIEKDRDCDVTVLEVDTIIHKEYKIKRVSDIDFEVKGRGGTILMPGIKRFQELNVDVCLCFTDGYTENFNEISRRLFPKRMIWAITPNGSDEKVNKVGYAIHLPERKT